MTSLAVGVAFTLPCANAADETTRDKVAFFENKVRPLLLARCVECHGDKKHKGGLRLDSRAGWAKGGESGPAIVPGKPDESLLIKAIRYLDKDLQMPPKKALTPQEVEILVDWVKDGAFDPRKDAAAGRRRSRRVGGGLSRSGWTGGASSRSGPSRRRSRSTARGAGTRSIASSRPAWTARS